MPVRKYRHIADVPTREIIDDPAAALRLACELSTLASRLAGRRPRPGLRKFRSIEEANTLGRPEIHDDLRSDG